MRPRRVTFRPIVPQLACLIPKRHEPRSCGTGHAPPRRVQDLQPRGRSPCGRLLAQAVAFAARPRLLCCAPWQGPDIVRAGVVAWARTHMSLCTGARHGSILHRSPTTCGPAVDIGAVAGGGSPWSQAAGSGGNPPPTANRRWWRRSEMATTGSRRWGYNTAPSGLILRTEARHTFA